MVKWKKKERKEERQREAETEKTGGGREEGTGSRQHALVKVLDLV